MDMNDPLPVFVHPSEVDFIIGKPETHKSLITIFNPYPWPIRFKILCNAPSKYTVGYTKGLIKQGCYLDTTIRHKNPMNVESNFLRIEIYRANDDEHTYPCGQKELALNVVKNAAFRPQSQQRLMEFADDDQQQQSTSNLSKSKTLQQRSHPSRIDHHQHRHPNSPNFYWLAIVSFLFCASILLLPQYAEHQNKPQNEGGDDQHQQQNSLIPNWMRPTSTSKCVSAYVLGILTVYFLQAVPT